MAARLLRPPSPDTDPREALRWTRRVEIVSGVVLVASGATLMNEGLPRWFVIGCGLLSLSPWPGTGAILRKAEKNPEILISDPQRRAERPGRVMAFTALSQGLIAGVVGYLIDGWGLAILMAVCLGGLAVIVSALMSRRST